MTLQDISPNFVNLGSRSFGTNLLLHLAQGEARILQTYTELGLQFPISDEVSSRIIKEGNGALGDWGIGVGGLPHYPNTPLLQHLL
jgi:hypothetical protein